MANRDRTDPNRSAQQQIFRGAGQGKGNQLGDVGGKPGSDIGSTRPIVEDDSTSTDDRPGRRHKKR